MPPYPNGGAAWKIAEAPKSNRTTIKHQDATYRLFIVLLIAALRQPGFLPAPLPELPRGFRQPVLDCLSLFPVYLHLGEKNSQPISPLALAL